MSSSKQIQITKDVFLNFEADGTGKYTFSSNDPKLQEWVDSVKNKKVKEQAFKFVANAARTFLNGGDKNNNPPKQDKKPAENSPKPQAPQMSGIDPSSIITADTKDFVSAVNYYFQKSKQQPPKYQTVNVIQDRGNTLVTVSMTASDGKKITSSANSAKEAKQKAALEYCRQVLKVKNISDEDIKQARLKEEQLEQQIQANNAYEIKEANEAALLKQTKEEAFFEKLCEGNSSLEEIKAFSEQLEKTGTSLEDILGENVSYDEEYYDHVETYIYDAPVEEAFITLLRNDFGYSEETLSEAFNLFTKNSKININKFESSFKDEFSPLELAAHGKNNSAVDALLKHPDLDVNLSTVNIKKQLSKPPYFELDSEYEYLSGKLKEISPIEFLPAADNEEHLSRHSDSSSLVVGSKALPYTTKENIHNILNTFDESFQNILETSGIATRLVFGLQTSKNVGTDAVAPAENVESSSIFNIVREPGTRGEAEIRVALINREDMPKTNVVHAIYGPYGPSGKAGIYTMVFGNPGEPFPRQLPPEANKDAIEANKKAELYWNGANGKGGHVFLITPQELEDSIAKMKEAGLPTKNQETRLASFNRNPSNPLLKQTTSTVSRQAKDLGRVALLDGLPPLTKGARGT